MVHLFKMHAALTLVLDSGRLKRQPKVGAVGVNLTESALIRPISARYSAGLSLRVSERSLVSRLES